MLLGITLLVLWRRPQGKFFREIYPVFLLPFIFYGHRTLGGLFAIGEGSAMDIPRPIPLTFLFPDALSPGLRALLWSLPLGF